MKKYNVIWSGPALRNILELIDYIRKDSCDFEIADNFVRELIKKTDTLETLPYRGRIVPEFRKDSIREIFFINRRIIYQISEDKVEILAVIHGARLLENLVD